MGGGNAASNVLKKEKPVFLVWLFSFLGILALNGLLFAAPALKHRTPGLSALIYAVFSPFCHQVPERCFVFQDFPLPVCGRCLGIYLGFAAGMILYPILRGFSKPSPPSTKAFLLVSLPVGIDVAGVFFRVWAGSIPLRLATGFIWGMILPFYWISGLSQAAALVFGGKKRSTVQGSAKVL